VRLADLITSVWQTRDAIENWQGRTLTGYTRGKVLEKLGRYEEAWEGYAFGAKARREAIGYNEDAYAQLHDAHRKLFTTAQLTSDPPPSDGGGQHVFIVSLPRSGSTLVEQIVSAHEAVETIGEQNIAAQAVNYWQKTHGPSPATLFKPAALADARAFYVGKARELVGREEAMIVDKSITNYVLLGFLHAIMPEARFLHVTRAPMDTGLSCFTTSFHSGNQWTYDLAEIGRNIRRYQGLMKHWMKLCPERILTISYETLVSDVETKTREIVSFCNLAWDPACLAFHESKAVVRTASVAQVRRPVYQTAKDRAAHFAAHLGPLRAALGRAADADWYRTPSQTQ